MTVSSGNPETLGWASSAVDPELHDRLAACGNRLVNAIVHFNRATQDPVLVPRVPDLTSPFRARVSAGVAIDTLLAQCADAFASADSWGPAGPFAGPWPDYRYIDDADLALFVGNPPTLDDDPFDSMRERPDGRLEVRGPDGEWYEVVHGVGPGASPVAAWRGTHDFGNENADELMAAGALLLGQITPIVTPAPPDAYDHIGFAADGRIVVTSPIDEDGTPTLETALAPDAEPPIATRPGGVAVIGGLGLVADALAGASAFADARYAGVASAQAQFYVDPRTLERVAVVDLAGIVFDGEGNPIVGGGRVTYDNDGPVVVPRRDTDTDH